MSISTSTNAPVLPSARQAAQQMALFRHAFHTAVARLIDQLASEHVLEEFPFLASYQEEAAALQEEAAFKEGEKGGRNPLTALRERANFDDCTFGVLFTVGLIEEDPRFGAIFEWAQPGSPGQQRATLALLTAWWREEEDCSGVRHAVRLLSELGFIQAVNPETARIFWAFQVTPVLWDILRGEIPSRDLGWVRYRPAENLDPDPVAQLILPAASAMRAKTLPRLLLNEDISCVLVRGPSHNGRRTLLGAIASAAGLGTLEVRDLLRPEDPRRALLVALAFMLHAMPLFVFELPPGETATLAPLPFYTGPLGVVLGRQGAVTGEAVRSAVTLELPFPEPGERLQIWSRALQRPANDALAWTRRFLLTSGSIHRSATLARAQAALEDRTEVTEPDLRFAHRALQQSLETQAVRLEPCGGWDRIVTAADTLQELRSVERRCRYREDLPIAAGQEAGTGVNRGVRALLSGPSGTGKTLAARVLAAELGLDLYRLDLSATVNKYVGETEKNLNQILSRAEELNVILLIDEGDALLTNRTAVQSSNDRYANLETNFLLQRIESFEGILLITTNALQRIDFAFQRRMDVLVEFRLPEPEERWNLWRLHLPPRHTVSDVWLEEAAVRCNLSGGQIRNAALHATLLALDASRAVNTSDAELSVQREYRKVGAVCPLRRVPPLR